MKARRRAGFRRRPNVTDRDRLRVLGAAREILSAGGQPTVSALAAAAPWLHRQSVEKIRREFLASGDLGPCADAVGGLTGETEEERAEIRRRYLKVRAAKVRREEQRARLGLNSRPMFDTLATWSLGPRRHRAGVALWAGY